MVPWNYRWLCYRMIWNCHNNHDRRFNWHLRDWNTESCTYLFNSVWPSDVIWWQGSRSTLAQVMACCLTAPSHYLNQCWLIISEVLWHTPHRKCLYSSLKWFWNLLIWDCSQNPQGPMSYYQSSFRPHASSTSLQLNIMSVIGFLIKWFETGYIYIYIYMYGLWLFTYRFITLSNLWPLVYRPLIRLTSSLAEVCCINFI